MHFFESFIHWVDWSKVAELSFAAILSLAVGAFLQWWLLRDQKRFQKEMLERQLAFMERLERERSDRDAKADAARIAAERAIVGHLASTLRQNSLNERNHAAQLQSRALSEARHRSMGS
jgi:hypothetical protein